MELSNRSRANMDDESVHKGHIVGCMHTITSDSDVDACLEFPGEVEEEGNWVARLQIFIQRLSEATCFERDDTIAENARRD